MKLRVRGGTRAARRLGGWCGALLLLLGAAVVGAAPPVEAHTGLQSASPAPRAHLGSAPSQIQLLFGQPAITSPGTRLVVTSPSGTQLTVGPIYSSAEGIAARLRASRETGRYQVSFAVVSVDGHVTTGAYPFWVTHSNAHGSKSGLPVNLWLPLLLTVIGLTGLIGAKARLRTPKPAGLRVEPLSHDDRGLA